MLQLPATIGLVDSDVKFSLKINVYKHQLILSCEVFSSIAAYKKITLKTSQGWCVNNESLLFEGTKESDKKHC